MGTYKHSFTFSPFDTFVVKLKREQFSFHSTGFYKYTLYIISAYYICTHLDFILHALRNTNNLYWKSSRIL